MSKNWNIFLKKLEKSDEMLVYSFFKRAYVRQDGNILFIHIPDIMKILEETIGSREHIWMQILKEAYNPDIKIKISFTTYKE